MQNYNSNVRILVDFMYTHGRALFHVTDQKHLESISREGLLSDVQRQAANIEPAHPGGNVQTKAFDADFGLSDYVFLSFSNAGLMPVHKDERHERRPILLYIDPAVLFLPGAKLALGRNSYARQKIYGVERALDRIDELNVRIFERLLEGEQQWEDVGLRDKWRLIHVMNFEVLIRSWVPPEYITCQELDNSVRL